MVASTDRTTLNRRMGWVLAGVLFALGSWLISQGVWIHVKATAAQWLLQHAWVTDP